MVHPQICLGQSGAGRVDFGKKGAYLSIDIGISQDDRAGAKGVPTFIADTIVSSVDLMRGLEDNRLATVDWDAVTTALRGFAISYKRVAEDF